MKLVCLSDTHNRHAEVRLPPGDMLIHAGDLTRQGTLAEARDALTWFGQVGLYRHRVLIAGNHDFLFERSPEEALALIPPNVTYLNDSGVRLGGLTFWGSPVTPWFHDWAFNRRSEAIQRHWELIPSNLDVLITHGPAFGVRDQVFPTGQHAGCPRLAAAILRVQPKLHLFGHIHEAYGQEAHDRVRSANVCVCDRQYRPRHAPTVLELEPVAP